MAKKPSKAKQRSLFPELDKIVSVLHTGASQDFLILIIPSHTQKEDELADQAMWANTAMELFADLYRGATAFHTFSGIYKTHDGKILRDKPIMIECYANRVDAENRDKLTDLLDFIKRMGRETNQAAVGLVINNVFHEITNFAVS